MSFDWNNPWLVGIVGGVVAGIVLYYLFGRREKRRLISIVESSVDNADQLLEKNMAEEALTIYKELLKKVSGKNEPVLFSYIKHQEGRCYNNLATKSNTEENLSKSIHAYEETLKIYTEEKYPEDYRKIKSNIDLAKKQLDS